ncbi:nucleotide pyrophosphohydrolase [Halobacterium hubeiense]|uniref:nucleotide pyrophosphohydrolase n=1 Tax=Halobacterium hubeiense TaxID=1407499 RepID=UPI003C756E8F
MELDELNREVREFCEAREWEQFHSPKDLGIGMVTESSELLEEFRFKDEAEQLELLDNPERREAVEGEVADVFFFLLRFADLYDIDLEEALERKLEENRDRYPVDEYKGSNKKYDE